MSPLWPTQLWWRTLWGSGLPRQRQQQPHQMPSSSGDINGQSNTSEQFLLYQCQQLHTCVCVCVCHTVSIMLTHPVFSLLIHTYCFLCIKSRLFQNQCEHTLLSNANTLLSNANTLLSQSVTGSLSTDFPGSWLIVQAINRLPGQPIDFSTDCPRTNRIEADCYIVHFHSGIFQ